jgi:small subunit ribosomal protein S15e
MHYILEATSRHINQFWISSTYLTFFVIFLAIAVLNSVANFSKKTSFKTPKMDEEKVAELRKKRQFRKFTFRGIELEALLDLTNDELMDLVCARARRRMSRGLKRKPMALIKRLRQAKKDAPPGEKPRGIKTHLRNMIIVPEMIGSIVGIYNGKMFCGVEMKPEMVGMYLGEFAITYKPVRHGRPGVSAAHQTRFIPL